MEYMRVEQMIEEKIGQNYSVYNNITMDFFTWNRLKHKIIENNYGNQEM